MIHFIKHNSTILIGLLIAGGLLGALVFYVIPEKYIGSGLFFITREAEISDEFYTYSGYYNQQTALSHTRTVRGIMETEEFQAMLLRELGIEVNRKSLRKFRKNYRVKETGPQLIKVEIKSNETAKLTETWSVLNSVLLELAEILVEDGDPNISTIPLQEVPLVREVPETLYVFSSVGALVTLGLGTLYLGVKEYLKER